MGILVLSAVGLPSSPAVELADEIGARLLASFGRRRSRWRRAPGGTAVGRVRPGEEVADRAMAGGVPTAVREY